MRALPSRVIEPHLCRPLKALLVCYHLISRNRPPVIIIQTMNSSAHVLPAPFARLAVQAQRPVHRASKVQPRKTPRTVEELDHHEEMEVERKNRKGIISVLAVRQEYERNN